MTGYSTARLAIAVATTLLPSGISSAVGPQLDESWRQCVDSNAEARISGCSVVLQTSDANAESRAVALYNRGIAYRRKGQLDLAIQDFDQALRLQPNDAEALNNRGITLDDMGAFDRAIQDFAKAIRLKPNYAEAYFNRANSYRHKSQHERAMQDKLPRQMGKVRAGTTAGISPDADAIRDYDQAIRVKSDYAAAFVNRGIAYYDKGQYDLAIEDYDEAIRLQPDLAEAYNNRALAYYKTNQYARALPDFDQTIRLNKNYGNALINRALGPSEAPVRPLGSP